MKIPTTLTKKTEDIEVLQADVSILLPQNTYKMVSTRIKIRIRIKGPMGMSSLPLVLKSYVEAQNQ